MSMKDAAFSAKSFALMALCMLPQLVEAQTVIPDMGDMNCDGASNVVDVQMSIQVALGMPLSTALDSDGDGVVDGCTEWVSGLSGDCAEGQILQWDGGLWVCADLPADSGGTGTGDTGPEGPEGPERRCWSILAVKQIKQKSEFAE